MSRRAVRRCRDERGFTLIETIMFLAVGGLVVASIVSMMMVQQRDYARQRDHTLVRNNLRAGVMHLTSELRGASTSGGDLSSFAPTSFVVRSVIGRAVICEVVSAPAPTYTLVMESGMFLSGTPDSALAFVVNKKGASDDAWNVWKVQDVEDDGAFSCGWPGGLIGPIRLEVSGDTANVRLGSPVLAFRRVEYGMFADGAEWWLGRRVAGAADWEHLVGPLAAPAAGGLALTYYDALGNVTGVLDSVRAVDISMVGLRASFWRSFGRTRDTLSTRVYLRG